MEAGKIVTNSRSFPHSVQSGGLVLRHNIVVDDPDLLRQAYENQG